MNYLKLLTIFIFLSVFCIFTKKMHAQSKKEKKGTLTINVNNIRELKGKIILHLFNNENLYYEEEVFKILSTAVTQKKVTLTIDDLPYGIYAFRLFHDRNNNRILDKMLMGKLKELCMYSNNISSNYELPNYEKISFKLDEKQILKEIYFKKNKK